MAQKEDGGFEIPLSPRAQECKEDMQLELLRKMAGKAMDKAMEVERNRRIREAGEPATEDALRTKAYDQLIVVQEDLVRCLNRMKVKELEETERAQRITEEKKHAVHEELLRKATIKQINEEEEVERNRRVAEEKNTESELAKDRQKTYDHLVCVQEQLLKTIQSMKVDELMKEEQQRRVTEDKKSAMQEQLVRTVVGGQVKKVEEKERERRVEELEHLTEQQIHDRISITHRMLDVQKELLKTHPPIRPIVGKLSQEVLDDAKIYMQEQLVRKARQKEAIAAMDAEQKRRITEGHAIPSECIGDAQSEILSEINRKASSRAADQLADKQQQDYIMAQKKARAEEDAMRKVHQKQADKAMSEEQRERVASMDGKKPPHISDPLKEEIVKHPHSPK